MNARIRYVNYSWIGKVCLSLFIAFQLLFGIPTQPVLAGDIGDRQTVTILDSLPSAIAIDPNMNNFVSSPNRANSLLGNCSLFPVNNIWNARIDSLPVHARSADWVTSIGRSTGFHMDFGSGTWAGGPIGIPYNIVGASTPKVPVSFYYADESDVGPYPMPSSPRIEFGSDHHILIVDSSTCKLYEIYDASYSGGRWHAGSGAIWDLNSNLLRPNTWTSADAAGLPILPGLVRYDEILSGKINHALRFTASQTNRYIWPARHLTSNDAAPQIPPMGARFRLKSSFNISGYSTEMQVILQAMKSYGIILADNGADWYVSGAPDSRWNNDMLHTLDALSGNDFEAVDTALIKVSADSGVVKAPVVTISGNAGEAGVLLKYTDGVPKSVLSDINGNYRINVPANWSGKIIPSKTGVISFYPTSRSYILLKASQTGQNYRRNRFLTLSSVSSQDGYILELNETSGVGGSLNSTSTIFMLGDDNLNRQYRAILSFDTGVLPDNAVIGSASLQITKQSITAEDPFIKHALIAMDIRKPVFGAGAGLALEDFKASAGLLNAGWVKSAAVAGVYTGVFGAAAFPAVNLVGTTQIRLRFAVDDDNDRITDRLSFYSGNSTSTAFRPILRITYHLP